MDTADGHNMAASTHVIALDALEKSVNSIFLQIGSAFSQAAESTNRDFTHVNTRLKSTLPSHLTSFNSALNELETEIARAKAVIQRDLVLLREDRNGVKKDSGMAAAVNAVMPFEDSQQLVDTTMNNKTSNGEAGLCTSDEKIAPNNTEETSQALKTSSPPSDIQNGTGNIETSQAAVSCIGPQNEQASIHESQPEINGQDTSQTTNQEKDDHLAKASTEKILQADMVSTHNLISGDVNQAESLTKESVDTAGDLDMILPGLEQYANEPGADTFNAMEDFSSVNLGNNFDQETGMNDAAGEGQFMFDNNNSGGEFLQGESSFEDMLNTMDGYKGQGGEQEGEEKFNNDYFNDDFFNLD